MYVGFVKPIQEELDNIVPNKKKNEQIYYCVDFHELNKACQKDEFPLLNIDMTLVNTTTDYSMFLFMDGLATIIKSRWTLYTPEKISHGQCSSLNIAV